MNETARILVVDDEPAIRQSVKEHLECDYLVDTSVSGTEALEMIEKRDYQLLISDLKLPGIDGLELVRQVKKAGLKWQLC